MMKLNMQLFAFEGNGFDKQLMKSNVFANAMARFFNNLDGTLVGCGISQGATSITIAIGKFVASGYLTSITSPQAIDFSGQGDGVYNAVYEIDLSKTNTTSVFNQGVFKIISGSPTQEDLFDGGNVYQLVMAQVTVAGGVITDVSDDVGLINGDALLKSGGTITGDLVVTGDTNSLTLKQNGKLVPDNQTDTTVPNDANGKDNDLYVQTD